MLSLLRPWALWLAPSLAIIAFLYFLRRRFRARPVGSAFLWQSLFRRADNGRKIQWRSILLLALQLLAAACAILAAAGPLWSPKTAGRIGTAFIVDASASMAARSFRFESVEEAAAMAKFAIPNASTFEAATNAVGNAIVTLENGNPQALVMVFAASDRLVPLGPPSAGGGKGMLALRRTVPTMASFDEGAVAADLAAWLEGQDSSWNVVLYTDGGLDGGGRLLYDAARGALTQRTIVPADDDIGLASLRVTGTALGGEASFTARSGLTETVTRSFLLSRDGAAVARADLPVPPGTSRLSLAFQAPPAFGAWELALADNDDALKWNDSVRQALRPDRRASVLLVGAGNPYLLSALSLPGLAVERRPKFPDPAEAPAWDFIVADRVPPPPAWPGKILIVGESGPDAAVMASGWVEGPFDQAEVGHPLARHLPLDDAGDYAGISYALGSGASAVATVGGKPVIVSWDEGGWGRVALGADLLACRFGSSLAFPVFFRNLIARFAPRLDGALSWTFEVGREETIEAPAGSRLVPSSGARLERRGTAYAFRAERPGSWEIQVPEGESIIVSANASEREQDLSARALALPDPLPPAQPDPSRARRELGKPLLLLLALLLAAEWLLWKGLPLAHRSETAKGAPRP